METPFGDHPDPLKIRAKSAPVEAMRFSDREELFAWMVASAMEGNFGYPGDREGMRVDVGDYVVRTADGKFFRVSADTFVAQYDVI